MNHVIILAGGVGSRFGADVPKQYLEIAGAPVLMHSFRKFAASAEIDSVVFVISDAWRSRVMDWLSAESFKQKILFAQAGKSRQHSVLNGLNALCGIAGEDDVVLIHDSVRPMFPVSSIHDAIAACGEYDGALPVITVKDAIYRSEDGKFVSEVMPKDQLYAGQTPECFNFGKFLAAHDQFTDEQVGLIRGSSELAVRAGLTVKLIPGTERNLKITTVEDIKTIENFMKECGD